MQNEILSPGQSVVVTALPKDDNEEPGTTDPGSQPQWSSNNPSVASIPANTTGLTATVTTGSTPGTAQIDVVFKAVAFGPSITSSFTVTVNENPATHLDFSFGTPQ